MYDLNQTKANLKTKESREAIDAYNVERLD
ncbi:hypothetical protein J2S19_000704 [Metabacillus malikii]|uniref:Uncharacterized protein n=1 Tax=Metabacillus malikii TaxID=1504265 RepID=A0ABT9ZB16_9BACI|nr:hypothetical protein [Metabacillus malikii]